MTNVDRLLELEKKIAERKPIEINGMLAHKILGDGSLLCTRITKEGTQTIIVEHPAVEWDSEVKRLKDEQEFRFLFGSISDAEFQEYLQRAGVKKPATA